MSDRNIQTRGQKRREKLRLADPSRIDRLPPHAIEAEQGVLGCCLLSRDAVSEAIEKLKNADRFYDLRHGTIFATLAEMIDRNEPIDLITVQQKLKDKNQLESVGGLAYLSSLPDGVPSAANLSYYGDIVYEKYLLRRYIAVSTECIARAFDFEEGQDAIAVFDSIERDILALSLDRVGSKDKDWKAVIQRTIAAMEEYHRGHAQMRGLPTGYDYFDKMTAGLAPGQMWVIAGRPGTGKTSLAFNIVEHIAVDLKLPVGVFSLEMIDEELGARSIFQRARADFQRFRTGYLENSDIPKLLNAAGPIASAPIKLDDEGDMNIMELRAKARRWKAQDGIKLLVIDYLQLVKGTKNYREVKDEVKEVSNGIKAMAKELRIPVIALCQLNRELEKDKNRLPRLSDLGESGAIERDADLIGIFYEPKLTDEEQEIADSGSDWARHSKRVNMQICKQRNGPTGKVEFLFQKACMRFMPYNRTNQVQEQPALESPIIRAEDLPTNEELGIK